MSNPFFDHPILNSPYECPLRHWELDRHGQPTQQVLEKRRRAEFFTPIPKPKKRRASAAQSDIVFDEGKGLSTAKQQYDHTAINEVRSQVDQWRALTNPSHWQVTPETARLLEHWRHHKFSGVRPFFCQIEAVETAIWLTEVAPNSAAGKRILELLAAASREANPELLRLALKLATGAGKTTVMAMLIAWQVNGVDVFHPNTGEVRSDGADGIACWFIDTDYNVESFFVRHAYFLGANDPYSALKTTLKAEINAEAWATLNSDTSRPFDKPKSGRIAVKVINHLGDEVMKVFRV